ncbi:hypothetical protein PFISCL1PPCAC_17925, partial [Pristionchus fissidentatus]
VFVACSKTKPPLMIPVLVATAFNIVTNIGNLIYSFATGNGSVPIVEFIIIIVSGLFFGFFYFCVHINCYRRLIVKRSLMSTSTSVLSRPPAYTTETTPWE